MRFDTAFSLVVLGKGSGRRAWRQILAVCLFGLLAGCSSSSETPQGTIGFVEGFLGGVAADEPRAALIGRDVLSADGTAADAATAVYFALAVTLPSSASLGGGGVCVVHDYNTKTTETLDFTARAPSTVRPGATRPTAVPGNPRGFYALQSRFGHLRWEQLIGPAENLARFGTPVSRALANDLAQVGNALLAEAPTRRIFGQDGGSRVAREGDTITQIELAAELGRIRRAGPGEFYDGAWAKQFVDAANAAGGSLSIEDLRSYRPVWRPTIRVPFGNLVAHFASPPGAAGGVAAEMWAMLTQDNRYADASPGERLHLLAETAQRAFADRGQWLKPDGSSSVTPQDLVAEARMQRLMSTYRANAHAPADSLKPPPHEMLENPYGTSFVVVDRFGSAVACDLTMNNLFGTGRFARGTGVLLAAMPGPAGRGPTSLGPMAVINENTNNFYLAATATGGVAAPTAMVSVAAATLLGKESPTKAMAAKRVHDEGAPDIVFFEHDLDKTSQQELLKRGHRLARTPYLGRVNMVACTKGIPPNPSSCTIAADRPPRGYGLAASAE